MEKGKRNFIITLIICTFIVLFFLFKDEIFEQINLLINPPHEYMSRHVSNVVLKELPQEKCIYEGKQLKEKCYIEVERPKEEVDKEIKEVKAGDKKERNGIRHELRSINRQIKKRPTAALYKQRAEITVKEMYVYRDLEKAKKFIPDFIKVSEEDPSDWKSPAFVGFGYIITGELDKAERYLQQSILRKPNAVAYFWLCELNMTKQNYAAALKALDKAEKLFKSPEYETLEIKFKNDDIRPFVYELYDTTLEYDRATILNSIHAVKEMKKRYPNMKMDAIID